ncbi:hypothetical protein [Teichococcus aestuarii]|uniref:hypothetical protein n=1 Tax=Teichococcus aestuarii TaxID=568898 RepID=UPI0015E7F92E|nr:hypothetical protein [Pseudoroseomonas aestuarii]
MKGSTTKTLFGDWSGDFDTLVAPLKPALDQISKILAGTPDEVIKAWDQLKEYFRN